MRCCSEGKGREPPGQVQLLVPVARPPFVTDSHSLAFLACVRRFPTSSIVAGGDRLHRDPALSVISLIIEARRKGLRIEEPLVRVDYVEKLKAARSKVSSRTTGAVKHRRGGQNGLVRALKPTWRERTRERVSSVGRARVGIEAGGDDVCWLGSEEGGGRAGETTERRWEQHRARAASETIRGGLETVDGGGGLRSRPLSLEQEHCTTRRGEQQADDRVETPSRRERGGEHRSKESIRK